MSILYFKTLKWIYFIGGGTLIFYAFRVYLPHLTKNQTLDVFIPFLPRVIPNYLAILSAIGILLVSFQYEDSVFSIFKEYNQIKGNPVSCFFTGVVASMLLVVLEHVKSPIIIMFSIFISMLILIPGIGLDWTSESVIIGTIGKTMSFGVGRAIYAEIFRYKNRKKGE